MTIHIVQFPLWEDNSFLSPHVPKTHVKRICHQCNKTYTTKRSRNLYFCSKLCANRAKSKSGENNAYWKGGEANLTCQLCGKTFTAPVSGVKRGQHKFCSNNCRTTYMGINPEMFPQTQTKRGKGGKREDLDNRYFRSAWEANYARYLNWLVAQGEIAKWEYEVDTFQFGDIKRGSRFYTPDFKVYDNDGTFVYHEVKGFMDERSATKLKRMAKYYPDVKVILIQKEEYKAISKWKNMFSNWE